MTHEFSPDELPPPTAKEQAIHFLVNEAPDDVVEKFYQFSDTYAHPNTPDPDIGAFPEILSHGIHNSTITVIRHSLEFQTNPKSYLVASYAVKLGVHALHTVTKINQTYKNGQLERILEVDNEPTFHLSSNGSHITTNGQSVGLDSAHFLKDFVQYRRRVNEQQ